MGVGVSHDIISITLLPLAPFIPVLSARPERLLMLR